MDGGATQDQPRERPGPPLAYQCRPAFGVCGAHSGPPPSLPADPLDQLAL